MAYDHLEIEARWGTILGEDNEWMSKSWGNVVKQLVDEAQNSF